ncbi:hypothetical protein ACP4OV_031600 [Aristida adscensionis]
MPGEMGSWEVRGMAPQRTGLRPLRGNAARRLPATESGFANMAWRAARSCWARRGPCFPVCRDLARHEYWDAQREGRRGEIDPPTPAPAPPPIGTLSATAVAEQEGEGPLLQFLSLMGKAKRASIFIRLVSAAGTGFFYVKRKNPRRITEKLEFRKYDPRVNKHVLFTEAKMK